MPNASARERSRSPWGSRQSCEAWSASVSPRWPCATLRIHGRTWRLPWCAWLCPSSTTRWLPSSNESTGSSGAWPHLTPRRRRHRPHRHPRRHRHPGHPRRARHSARRQGCRRLRSHRHPRCRPRAQARQKHPQRMWGRHQHRLGRYRRRPHLARHRARRCRQGLLRVLQSQRRAVLSSPGARWVLSGASRLPSRRRRHRARPPSP